MKNEDEDSPKGLLGGECRGPLAKRVISFQVLVVPAPVEATAEDEVLVAEDLLAPTG